MPSDGGWSGYGGAGGETASNHFANSSRSTGNYTGAATGAGQDGYFVEDDKFTKDMLAAIPNMSEDDLSVILNDSFDQDSLYSNPKVINKAFTQYSKLNEKDAEAFARKAYQMPKTVTAFGKDFSPLQLALGLVTGQGALIGIAGKVAAYLAAKTGNLLGQPESIINGTAKVTPELEADLLKNGFSSEEISDYIKSVNLTPEQKSNIQIGLQQGLDKQAATMLVTDLIGPKPETGAGGGRDWDDSVDMVVRKLEAGGRDLTDMTQGGGTTQAFANYVNERDTKPATILKDAFSSDSSTGSNISKSTELDPNSTVYGNGYLQPLSSKTTNQTTGTNSANLVETLAGSPVATVNDDRKPGYVDENGRTLLPDGNWINADGTSDITINTDYDYENDGGANVLAWEAWQSAHPDTTASTDAISTSQSSPIDTTFWDSFKTKWFDDPQNAEFLFKQNADHISSAANEFNNTNQAAADKQTAYLDELKGKYSNPISFNVGGNDVSFVPRGSRNTITELGQVGQTDMANQQAVAKDKFGTAQFTSPAVGGLNYLDALKSILAGENDRNQTASDSAYKNSTLGLNEQELALKKLAESNNTKHNLALLDYYKNMATTDAGLKQQTIDNSQPGWAEQIGGGVKIIDTVLDWF